MIHFMLTVAINLVIVGFSHPDLYNVINDSEFILSVEQQEVLGVEKMRFKAMVEKDLNTLKDIIHDDLVYIHSNGSTDTKASFIEAIEMGKRFYEDITIRKEKIRIYGITGIINAQCTYHRTMPDGKPNNLSLYYTSVYVRNDGHWKHVSWQSFRLPD